MNELDEIREAVRKDPNGRERIWARLAARDVETGDHGLRMGGTAAVFGAEARVRLRDGRVAKERLAESAFNNTLRRGDIFLLWQHDPAEPLARTGAGNLNLEVRTDGDLPGLDWVAENMPDTQRVRDAAALMSSRVVDKMSFGFTVPDGGDTLAVDDDGVLVRTLHDVRLAEISLVTWPAYQETSAHLRSDAFGLLCRSLGWDEVDVLARCQTGDMIDLSAASLRAEPGAVTTSEDASQAATTVTAGDPTHRLLLMRLRERARGTELPKVSNGTPSGTGPGR